MRPAKHLLFPKPMSITRGLTCLGMLAGRGLDNGQEGAVMLANQVGEILWQIFFMDLRFLGLHCNVWYWGKETNIFKTRGKDEKRQYNKTQTKVHIKQANWKGKVWFQVDINKGILDNIIYKREDSLILRSAKTSVLLMRRTSFSGISTEKDTETMYQDLISFWMPKDIQFLVFDLALLGINS